MSSGKPAQGFKTGRGAVAVVEERVVARRAKVKALIAAIRQKSHVRAVSAGMLTGAFGAGIALEQINRRRVWWLVSLLGTVNTLERVVSVAGSLLRPGDSSAPPDRSELSEPGNPH